MQRLSRDAYWQQHKVLTAVCRCKIPWVLALDVQDGNGAAVQRCHKCRHICSREQTYTSFVTAAECTDTCLRSSAKPPREVTVRAHASTLLCICGGVGREEGQFRHEVIAHPSSRRCGDGGVRRECSDGAPSLSPALLKRRRVAAEVEIWTGTLPALTTMNPLLEQQRGKRFVRWASRADLGLDRHFALWSRDPVPVGARLETCHVRAPVCF